MSLYSVLPETTETQHAREASELQSEVLTLQSTFGSARVPVKYRRVENSNMLSTYVLQHTQDKAAMLCFFFRLSTKGT